MHFSTQLITHHFVAANAGFCFESLYRGCRGLTVIIRSALFWAASKVWNLVEDEHSCHAGVKSNTASYKANVVSSHVYYTNPIPSSILLPELYNGMMPSHILCRYDSQMTGYSPGRLVAAKVIHWMEAVAIISRMNGCHFTMWESLEKKATTFLSVFMDIFFLLLHKATSFIHCML